MDTNTSLSNQSSNADSGFAGTLKNIQLNDLIQMCCLSASSLCMQVTKGQRKGIIVIVDGEIVHAAYGDITGEEAFYQILGWQTGNFDTLEVSTPPERTINKNYQFLVMEAARRADEQDLAEDPADEILEAIDIDAGERLRVLIVDDSPMMRKILSTMLNTSNRIDVVGMAGDGKEAITLINELSPDLVMLDVNMPVMDGTSTIKHIMIKKPCPVVIMSNPGDGMSKKIFNFLELGAVDFIGKPIKNDNILMQQQKIVERIEIAATARVGNFRIVRIPKAKAFASSTAPCRRLVIIISGPGGHPELLGLLSGLVPAMADIDGAVVALQSLPPAFTDPFAQYVNERCGFLASTIDTETPMCVGGCYVSMLGARLSVGMSDERPVIDTHPFDEAVTPIDGLLVSASTVFKQDVAVVLLSGANPGGQTGLRSVDEQNGRVIFRQRSSSLVPGTLDAVAESGLVTAEVAPGDLLKTVLAGFDTGMR